MVLVDKTHTPHYACVARGSPAGVEEVLALDADSVRIQETTASRDRNADGLGPGP